MDDRLDTVVVLKLLIVIKWVIPTKNYLYYLNIFYWTYWCCYGAMVVCIVVDMVIVIGVDMVIAIGAVIVKYTV